MSLKRGKYLVELCEQKDTHLIKGDEKKQDFNQERVSSPVPDDFSITPQFLSIYEDVFQEQIEQCDDSFLPQYSSPSHAKQNQVTTDVNLHTATEFDSPINHCSPSLAAAGMQEPSPMTLTPQSVEPLFSCSLENNDFDKTECTPMPSPCCDFTDFSDPADETLVPMTSTHEDVDVTLTTANIPSLNEDVSPVTPLHPLYNATNSESYTNSLSISSTITSSDCTNFEGSETSTPKNKRTSKKRSDKGRKRNIHVEDWMATKRKRLCNMGQEYTSRRGTVKEARKIKPSCSCRLRCGETFTEQIRSELFSNFWGTGSHVKQWQIICKYVDRNKKKSCTNLNNEVIRRSYTLHYHLPIKSNDETTLKKVCKTMFLNTFSISKDFVYTALQKNHDCTDFDDLIDGRGRHKNHNRVVTDEMKQSVLEHVNSYAPVESHYVRKRSSIKYLDPSLSFSKMFKMYPAWCVENGYNSRVHTLRQYKDIVNANLKIGFHVPKKDQCDLCHQFKNTPEVSDEQKEKYAFHQKEKEYSRKLKLENKLLATNDNKKACIVFDFQKVLNAPHGNISIYYYRRKLNVYNFTVYDMASKEAYCYMWDEQTAGRGANEVASCLYDFLSKLASKGITEVYFWSDNCAGQNRNRIVYYMYLLAASKLKINIFHRFMEKGHTQNEGDSVHALIEKSAKGKEIYSPDEWYSLVRWAKVNDKPYNVIEVKQDMILDFKKGIANKNWTKNVCNDKVSWNKIKEIGATPEEKGMLRYKYSLSDLESQQIQCLKKSGTRQSRPEPLPDKAYESFLKINKAKYNDLVYFCENNIIPQKYHSIYKNLTTTEVNHDIDRSEEED